MSKRDNVSSQGGPMIEPSFRRATAEDAGTLAELVQFASEGLALYLWTQIAGTRHDPWDIGRERVRSEAHGICYKNAIIAELSGRPTSGVISYLLRDRPDPIPDELPAVLMPLHELMNEAPDTWYVHALAVYPSYRGRGQGSALLAVVDKLAAASGTIDLSLIVSDTNVSARKLYERCGYREAVHREMVKEHWSHPGTNWVLMRKRL
jgi:ribosomal protein S18 acetylase RimI-like enzyme